MSAVALRPRARRAGLPAAVLLTALVGALAAIFLGAGAASAQTIGAQLTLTGVATSSSPTGGSQVSAHPGDYVTFSAATVAGTGSSQPVTGILGSVLSTAGSVQMRADFSGLPGGTSGNVLTAGASRTFRFDRAGTYSFSWTAERVVPLAGTTTLGQYTGQVVVAANPPQGGQQTVQLPKTSYAPPAGQSQPTSGATQPATQPTTQATAPGSDQGAAGASTAPASTAPSSPLPIFTAPVLTVPQQVVPRTGSAARTVDTSGNSGGGGIRLGAANGAGGVALGGSGQQSGDGAHVGLASQDTQSAGQLPVLLAILAVIALAVAAGTYARIFLLGQGATVRTNRRRPRP